MRVGSTVRSRAKARVVRRLILLPVALVAIIGAAHLMRERRSNQTGPGIITPENTPVNASKPFWKTLLPTCNR